MNASNPARERRSRLGLLALPSRMFRGWLCRSPQLRWGSAVLWASLIWFASSRTGSGLPPSTVWLPVVANAMHVALFLPLALLVFAGLQARAGEVARRRHVLAVAMTAGFGIVDELHQSFVPGRTASVWDLATDLTAAVLGVAIASRYWLGALEPGVADRRFGRLVPGGVVVAAFTVAGASGAFG